MNTSTQPAAPVFPKSKSELFNEYQNRISYGTFRKWIKALSDEGKIRKGKKVLNVKEVMTVYEELGMPGTPLETDKFGMV